MPDIILASASPRRRHFMQQLNLNFEIIVADIDETPLSGETPETLAWRLAKSKAEAVSTIIGRSDDTRLIVASDTVVAMDGHILGKPVNENDAGRMLRLLRDNSHQVHTAICLLSLPIGTASIRLNTTDVTMRPYSDEEIAAYVATGDPLDKAGAYAIQHPDFAPVTALDGCFSAVMGFPLGDLCDLLGECGVVVEPTISKVCEQHTSFTCCRGHVRESA